MIENLIARWGYLAVLMGALFEGEGTTLAAGALVHKGLLLAAWALLSVIAGTLLSDQLWFLSGRKLGRRLLVRRPKLAAHSQRIERLLDRYGALFVVSLRFLYGLRAASVVWLGSSGYPYRRFAAYDALGAVLWSSTMLAMGWGLGAVLRALLGRMGHAAEILLVVACIGSVAFGVWRVRRTRQLRAA